MQIEILVFVLLIKPIIETQAKVFNAIASLDPLIQTQAKVISGFEEYLKAARNKITFIENHIRHSQESHKKAQNDHKYFRNPINAFSFMNRVARGFGFVKNITKERIGYSKDNTLLYPNKDDLNGASKGIVRLQTTYRLNITHLASGTLISNFSDISNLYVEHVTPMISCDCYLLGTVDYKEQGFSGQLRWMKEALKKHYSEKCDICTVTEAAILLKIQEAYLNLGEIKMAIKYLKKFMSLKPAYRQKEDRKNLQDLQERVDKGESHKSRKEQKRVWKQPRNKKLYGCYENLKLRNVQKSKLFRCGYESRTPYMTYGPVKEEMLSFTPNVVFFHDVISDAEIEALKNLAKPKLIDTGVVDVKDNKVIVNKDNECRISKGAVLGHTYPLVVKLVQRIGNTLGVNMTRAIKIHVINYGIGGVFSEHVDYLRVVNSHDPEEGDRLISFVYFLSDVEQGGALVFPVLGLKVYPKKGAAIAWSVLHPSGDGHLGMIHTACPAIRGSRWIAINWSVELDQDSCPLWFVKDGIMTEERYSKWIANQREIEMKAFPSFGPNVTRAKLKEE